MATTVALRPPSRAPTLSIDPEHRRPLSLKHLLRSKHDREPPRPQVSGRPARVPEGMRVYAVGDIHGRCDLLAGLHAAIARDADGVPPGTELVVVYVGDYVDRGLESRGVLDHLLELPLRRFRAVHLLGNHDAWLLAFLADPGIGPAWLRFGGDATVLSYGVRRDEASDGGADDGAGAMIELQRELRARIPARHRAFLERLKLTAEFGDYIFVHAGIRPGVPLDRQRADDLLWIREPFLRWRGEAGKVVVHGHTVHVEPEVRPNRIGIDTGAYWTGCLTALVLEGESYRFLSTGGRPG